MMPIQVTICNQFGSDGTALYRHSRPARPYCIGCSTLRFMDRKRLRHIPPIPNTCLQWAKAYLPKPYVGSSPSPSLDRASSWSRHPDVCPSQVRTLVRPALYITCMPSGHWLCIKFGIVVICATRFYSYIYIP
jgi:hypothetical protein